MANQECFVTELTKGAPVLGEGQVGFGAINICVSRPSRSIEKVEAELMPLFPQTSHEFLWALLH